jgi:DNA (cytosine-5)-methyltransferase 1
MSQIAHRAFAWYPGRMIPVIDLFAGPGGLGEGFSALRNAHGSRVFKIGLSIEKDVIAHRTLLLRSFFRQFDRHLIPEEYYSCVRGQMELEDMFKKYQLEAKAARKEAICAELGKHDWKEIDDQIKVAIGQTRNWVLIGGPPCQAYSLAGRSRMRGTNPWKFGKDKRHLLYREYLRIIAAHRPPVFVMENVKGMLSSKFRRNPIIDKILGDLREPHKALPELMGGESCVPVLYNLYPIAEYSTGKSHNDANISPEKFVLRCEEHGIPQARHRVVLVGIRSDISKKIELLSRQKRVPVRQAIKDLPEMRSRLSKKKDTPDEWLRTIEEICDSTVVPREQLEPKLRQAIRRAVTKLTARRSVGAEFVETTVKPKWNSKWFYDARLGGSLNHTARSHIAQDLRRYFFAACFGKYKRKSPSIADFPFALIPLHKNLKDKKPKDIVFADRFRVQVAHKPATTITSHISKDGHYFIHPDPTQCRSMTVREAARIQTFPDNYYFAGPRTAQYHQVGNAVPPLIARDIARVVARLFR